MCTDREQLSLRYMDTKRCGAVSVTCCHMVTNDAHVDYFWKDMKITGRGDCAYLTYLKNR